MTAETLETPEVTAEPPRTTDATVGMSDPADTTVGASEPADGTVGAPKPASATIGTPAPATTTAGAPEPAGAVSRTNLSAGPRAAPPQSGIPAWVIVLIVFVVLGVVAVPVMGLFAASAIYGIRRYVTNAKVTEARTAVATFAEGVAQCAADRGMLPDTTGPVPPHLASVSGRKYQSSPGDWSDDAFACAKFSLAMPQYYQYQWVRESETTGFVRASADLDGDGIPSELRLAVTCTDQCEVAPSYDERDLME